MLKTEAKGDNRSARSMSVAENPRLKNVKLMNNLKQHDKENISM
jgi:hypothetical protein